MYLQRRFRCDTPVHVDRSTLAWKLRCVALIQRNGRGFVARVMAKNKLGSLLLIQRWHRGELVRRKHREVIEVTVKAQAMVRGRQTRFVYALLRGLVSKVQAHVRGIQVRTRMRNVLEGRMSLYRRQIHISWNYAHTPLAFRTKLWPHFATKVGFLRMSVAEAELKRLWEELGTTVPKDEDVRSLCDDQTFQIGHLLGIDNYTYCRCVLIDLFDQNKRAGAFPAAQENDTERLQIYEKLSSKAASTHLEAFYKQFEIPVKDNVKKLSLAKLVWTKYDHAKASQTTIMTLFPELEGSVNIIFLKPSAKSKRRFPNANMTVPPVEQSLWDTASLEGRIKKHMKEVVIVMETKVPAIMSWLVEAEGRKVQRHMLQRDASMKARGGTGTDWLECRHRMLVDFLAGRHDSFQEDGRREAGSAKGLNFPDIESIKIAQAKSPKDSDPLFPDIELIKDKISQAKSPKCLDPLFPDIELIKDKISQAKSSKYSDPLFPNNIDSDSDKKAQKTANTVVGVQFPDNVF
jgi:hypothetical protein